MGQAIGQVGQGMDPNGTFGAPGGLDQYPVGPDYPQPGQAPGMGGKGPSGPPTGGMDPRPVGPGYPQPGQAPGMGGKGPLAQIPIDMSGQVLGAGQTALPGQAPGLPTPQAPMVPQGGMQPRSAMGAPGGLDQYPVGPGYPQPGQGPFQTRPMPAPAVYGRNAVVNPRARVTAQPVQSMKRGAGRGGLLR